MAPTHFVYLHGFRSSPGSVKARRVAGWLSTRQPQVEGFFPQLPPSPREAIDGVERQLRRWCARWPDGEAALADRVAVMGSSLGGFYATHLAERFGCRTVLLNPAVDPARDLARHLGEQTNWHDDERFFFEPRFLDELRALSRTTSSRPDRLMAVIATGDEVLDWTEMRDRYRGACLRIVEGSDHALSDFDAHVPAAMAFLGLGSPQDGPTS